MLHASRYIKLLLVLELTAPWVSVAQQPRRVDDAALRDAGRTGEEWITYNGNWSEQRYSPLSQINATNINRLGPAWYTDIPAAPGPPQNRQEATPLMYDGRFIALRPGAWCMRSTPERERRSGVRIRM